MSQSEGSRALGRGVLVAVFLGACGSGAGAVQDSGNGVVDGQGSKDGGPSGVCPGAGVCFVAVAGGGIVIQSGDGVSWRASTPFKVQGTAEIALDNSGRIVGVGGEGRVNISVDRGDSWTIPTAPPRDSVGLDGVAFGGGRWVAVGTQYSENYLVAFSSLDNGETWTEGTMPDTTAHQACAVAYGGGVWVAVGSGGVVIRSVDGASWQQVDSGVTSWLNDVVFADGRFVAVGEGGAVRFSDDLGLTWQSGTTGSSAILEQVLAAGGKMIALGYPAEILISSDGGSSWDAATSPTNEEINVLVYGSWGRLVALGESKPSDRTIFYSDDLGAGWQQGTSDYNYLAVGGAVAFP